MSHRLQTSHRHSSTHLQMSHHFQMSHRLLLFVLLICFASQGTQAQHLAPLRDAAPSGRWTAPQNSAGGKMLRRAPLPFPQQTSTGIVYASFYAPDSATAIVDADTGQSWTQLVGTWGLINIALTCRLQIPTTVIARR
jgi:hypothetical protein